MSKREDRVINVLLGLVVLTGAIWVLLQIALVIMIMTGHGNDPFPGQ